MSAKQQNELVANYIVAEIPNEPSRSEGAGDCAVRLLKEYRVSFERIVHALRDLDDTKPGRICEALHQAGRALQSEW